MSTGGSSNDDLRQQADQELSGLPAETALGNADPAGGVQADPQQYDREHAGQHTTHDGHDHQHGPDCGHDSQQHGDHVDYLHDGHRHAEHDGHYDEH